MMRDQTQIVEHGVEARPLAGEQVCGDDHLVQDEGDKVFFAVADGLGHGEHAARAARRAMDHLATTAGRSLEERLASCHDTLKETRGAVVTLGTIALADGTLEWTGLGNVEGRVVRVRDGAAEAGTATILRGGVVGHGWVRPLVSRETLTPGDLVVLATDGVRQRFLDGLVPERTPDALARDILDRHARGTDDALVLVLRYKGGEEED